MSQGKLRRSNATAFVAGLTFYVVVVDRKGKTLDIVDSSGNVTQTLAMHETVETWVYIILVSVTGRLFSVLLTCRLVLDLVR
jgi:hypothetical protein